MWSLFISSWFGLLIRSHWQRLLLNILPVSFLIYRFLPVYFRGGPISIKSFLNSADLVIEDLYSALFFYILIVDYNDAFFNTFFGKLVFITLFASINFLIWFWKVRWTLFWLSSVFERCLSGTRLVVWWFQALSGIYLGHFRRWILWFNTCLFQKLFLLWIGLHRSSLLDILPHGVSWLLLLRL